jgi:hypothetical protein
MKSFVKVNNGTFPNLNFYMAWEAFNTMGFGVQLFEEKDIPILDITRETPVFAGVTVFRKIIDKLGVNYPPFDCYPKILDKYYGRNIRRTTLGEVRSNFERTGNRVFVKPIKPKVFTGVVLNSLLELIPITNIKDDTEVFVCEPVDIISEVRVYVNDGEILGVKHYYGEWDVLPTKNFIKEVVKNHDALAPIAYGVDIGITHERKSIVVEVNDGCNLGNYGLDSIYYGEMIVSRWFEIMKS